MSAAHEYQCPHCESSCSVQPCWKCGRNVGDPLYREPYNPASLDVPRHVNRPAEEGQMPGFRKLHGKIGAPETSLRSKEAEAEQRRRGQAELDILRLAGKKLGPEHKSTVRVICEQFKARSGTEQRHDDYLASEYRALALKIASIGEPSRARSIALTRLEESMLFAFIAASYQDDEPEAEHVAR